MPGVGTTRYGAHGGTRRPRSIQGGVYLWRAYYRTPWGYVSPWSDYDTFGVTLSGTLPVARLVPLPLYVWSQPLSQWTYFDADGDTLSAYQLQLASDAAFSSIVYDSGVVSTTSTLSYQHSGLAAGTYYRRIKVQTAGADWSDYDQDSFTIQTATTQASVLSIYRVHWDDNPPTAPQRSKIYAPMSSPSRTARLDGPGEFSFVPNNFQLFVERKLVSCWHFDEVVWGSFTPATAHDIVSRYDLALTGSPAWTSAVLNLASTQYGQSGSITWTLDQDFNATMVLYPSGTSGCIFFVGAYANDANYYSVQYNGSGNIRIVVSGAQSANLAVPTTSWVIVTLERSGSTLTLTRADTGANVTLATPHPTGTARIAVGRYAGATPASIVDALKIDELLLYSDDTTAAEDARNVLAIRANLSWRGVTI